MSVHLRRATEADLADIVDVSTAAFDPSSDAISRHLFPPHLSDKETLRKSRITRKSVRFKAKRNVMMVAIDDTLNGRIVGYAIWEMPVQEGDEEESQPPPMTPAGADPAAFAEVHRIMEEDARENLGERGTKDLWLLASFGVDPQHQRRGIGRMLLSWGIREATKQEKDCYLVATPAGHSIYRAVGFEDVKIMEIFGTPHTSMRKRYSPSQTVNSLEVN